MPLPPTPRPLSTRRALTQQRGQRSRLADAKSTLGATGLMAFKTLLEMSGASPVLPMVYWAAALREQSGVVRATGETAGKTVTNLKHMELVEAASKRAKARKDHPSLPAAQFEPPFASTLPRVAGWCRVLSSDTPARSEVPGFAFYVKAVSVTGEPINDDASGEPLIVNALGKAIRSEAWRASIVWIYEHKTGSLFHYVSKEGSGSRFTYNRLWLCLEKAVEILRQQPGKKFPTIPAELFEAQATVFLPLGASSLPMAKVFDAAQHELDQHRQAGQRLHLQKVNGKSVQLDPARWQVQRHSAGPDESYDMNLKSKDILISSLARHARTATSKLTQLHRKNQPTPQENSKENGSQRRTPNATSFIKAQSAPDDRRFSWRPLSRVRHKID